MNLQAFVGNSLPDLKLLAALVLAKSGDAARANGLTRELENKNPLNTLIKSYWLPTVKASLEVRAGNPQTALSLLQIAAPYELAQTSNVSNVSNMYPAYIRGQAYLLAHNGGAAAAEFKKLLDHRGIVQNSILGALSLLQLARAEVMMGDLGGSQTVQRLSLFVERRRPRHLNPETSQGGIRKAVVSRLSQKWRKRSSR